MKVKKGDRVKVLAGKDRGTEGVVLKVLPSAGKVVVEGVNIARRHTKSKQAGSPGGIIDKVMPIDASNVAVINPKDGKPTRVGYRFDGEGNKLRICKRTGDEL